MPTNMDSQKRRGQGLVEFALVLPILLFAIFGIIDFGRVLTTYAMASNSVRDALRRAETIGYVTDSSVTPPYADCATMRTVGARVFFVDSDDITIEYGLVYNLPSPATAKDIFWVTCSGAAYTPPNLNGVCNDTQTVCDLRTLIYQQRALASPASDPNDLQNGDILRIGINRNIQLITPGISSITPVMPVRISGERTIIKEIPLNCSIKDEDTGDCLDTDFDGLADWWEYLCLSDHRDESLCLSLNTYDDWKDHWGANPPTIQLDDLYDTGTDDPDQDGCNNGCEQARLLNPYDPDTDNDGLTDGEEAYIFITSGLRPDTDSDGLTDCQEVRVDLTRPLPAPLNSITCTAVMPYRTDPRLPDTDRDGVNDYQEALTDLTGTVSAKPASACPSTFSFRSDPTEQDTDGDGGPIIPGDTANDTNVDGIIDRNHLSDWHERNYGTDPNNTDTDCDGLTDEEEIYTYGTDPLNWDTDGDGLNDGTEVYGWSVLVDTSSVTYTSNPHVQNEDNDDLNDNEEYNGWHSLVNTVEFWFRPDPRTADYDSDGLNDSREKACGTDPYDDDTDGDGLPDDVECDNPPLDPLVANPNTDGDGDGLPDIWEGYYFFNTLTPTEAQLEENDGSDDYDNDGCDNLCEFENKLRPNNPDTDTDGLMDGYELTTSHTNPKNPDSDSDGLKDGFEENPPSGWYQTNPNNPDTDNDGLKDGAEYVGCTARPVTINGSTSYPSLYQSNPTLADSDSDGLNDKDECDRGVNPLDDDTDDDGLTDGEEVTTYGTDPLDDDTDDDGLTDGEEVDLWATYTQNCPDPLKEDSDGDYRKDGDEPGQGRSPCFVEPPTIIISDEQVNETASNVSFTVTLQNPIGTTVTVNYATANDTATVDADYYSRSGQLTFPAQIPPPQPPNANQTVTITVPILNDTIDEEDETLVLNLSGASGAIIDDAQGVATIIDDDPPPSVTIPNVTGWEDRGPLVFTATLSAASERTISFNWSTSSNLNAPQKSVADTSGSLTFSPGETSKTISLPVTDDVLLDDSNEIVTLALSNAVHVTLPGTAPTGTVIDDEAGYEITIAADQPGGTPEQSGPANFTISLDRAVATGETVSVRVRTTDVTARSTGTPTNGQDYTARDVTVTFNPGESSKAFPVTINNDDWNDSFSSETFTVTLSNPSANAALSTLSATGTIIDNEPIPTVRIGNAGISKSTNQNSTTSGSAAVTLSGRSESAITVNFTTTGGKSPQQGAQCNTANCIATSANYSINTTSPITFTALTTTLTQNIAISVTDVNKQDISYFYFQPSLAANSTAYATITDPYGDVTLCSHNTSNCAAPNG